MNFQENLFGSSFWSLMQLTQSKNVVKVTQVFLQCIQTKNPRLTCIIFSNLISKHTRK